MRALFQLCLGCFGVLTTQPLLAADINNVPLIARAKLFGNPVKANGRISPDGKWLSWIAPRDGVLNIWVAPVGDPDAAKPLTDRARRGRSASISGRPTRKQILFIQDKGGDENFLLYGVDVATGEAAHADPVREDPRRRSSASRTLHQGPHPRRAQQPRCQVARRPQPRPRRPAS